MNTDENCVGNCNGVCVDDNCVDNVDNGVCVGASVLRKNQPPTMPRQNMTTARLMIPRISASMVARVTHSVSKGAR